ncbi:hypothetical protein LOTGIDRAFT_235577 [Lottia gigantea]|uniref:Peptidase M14 domain-containing protein n=1 Tax=Lottia gigantea TaxID=225164 RepID=V3ZTU3_LOTGI|nr:hypothetical protein LOTGIDRAFT_235577 [Lottia gigantea]ESO85980.1 hypothetical protein LOTGIDRAFT_235577 [Lottia gigantea]
MIVYDSERSQRDYLPQPVPEGCCPNLVFESRFESANLRQARRVGQFEYELVLRTDLYTNRHTQWYYFRVSNAIPGITYKFRIVNLLKRDSLYNYGMRPLIYSEKDAREEEIGWRRTGHHISYSNNIVNHTCPLLEKGISYYMLEWQMEFPHEDDTYYMAHCYPYTFTDLKEDVDTLLADPDRQQYIKREVLCETRAGNSCFLLTVTNNKIKTRKKFVVISARVHPGETQASWMMRGLLYFITSQHQSAQKLRDTCIFKIVPMLNPDGVIVGNYRCSLAARDLNRNYRHPKHDNFPTIYNLKNMVENLLQKNQVVLYCDLHGHSRKENVFMYGNNKETSGCPGQEAIQSFISDRVFPWLMAVKSPEKFSFNSCKFKIKRCKESTGRVVMWRQMKIPNSFTLEATFSGTILDKSSCRHFNCGDFEDMGKTLCEVVLDYQTMEQDTEYKNKVIAGLTRAITHQILAKRGLLPKNMQLRDLHSGKVSDSGISVEGSDSSTGCQTDNDKPADNQSELNTADDTANTQLSLATQKQLIVQNGRHVLEKQQTSKLSTETSSQEKIVKGDNCKVEDEQKILEETSLNSLDGCLNILAQLNVCEAMLESDSSDSDSESEPEIKPPEIKQRKKKRKSRKQRDRENKKIENERKSSIISNRNALPVITGRGSVSMTTKTEVTSGINPVKKQQGNIKRLEQVVTNQQFISKYQGRTNGGLPCFTEERSMERAAKRMAELQRRSEEGKEEELLLYYEDEFPYSRTMSGLPLQRTVTEEEFNKRIQLALHEGTSNLTQTLVGNSIKTVYTHTESNGGGMKSESYLQGIQQSPSFSLPITFPMVTNNNNNNNTLNNLQPESLSDDTDDVLEIRRGRQSIPVTVQKSPYQYNISPTSKHHQGRSGSVLQCSSQSNSTTTSPLVTSAILNKSSNQSGNHSDNNIQISNFPNKSLIGNLRRSHVRHVTSGD